jgi:hypothetical protein
MALPSGYTLVSAPEEKEKQSRTVKLPAGFSLVEPEAKPSEAPKVQLPEGFTLVDSAPTPAKAEAKPAAPQAPSDTNIFGERNVEGIMGVPSVKGPLPPITSEDAFSGSFGRSIYNLGADAALLGGKITGDTAAAQKRAEELRAAGEGTYTPTDKSFTEAPIENFAELLGGSLPYMVAPAAAAMAAPVLGPAAITAPLVGGATSALQFTGSNLARQMEDNKKLEDTNLLTAGLTAIPQAALDIYGFRLIPGIRNIFGKAGMDISESVAEQLAKKSLLTKAGEYALGTGKIMGLEGATETGQQLLERLQAGLSITDEEARKEYFDSFVGGAVLGGALAVPGSAVEYAANKFANTPERAAEEAKQSALEAWRTKGLTTNLPKKETYDDLVTKYTSLGQTKENAVRLANQDIADQQEAEDARRIDSGVAGDSTQISGEPATEPTAEGTEQLVGPTVDGVGVAARPIEEGTVQQPVTLTEIPAPVVEAATTVAETETEDPTKKRFEDFLGKTFKRQLMEAKGQDILDSMEESNTSPKDVAAKFWGETYFNLPAPVQERFNNELKAQTGMEPGSVTHVDANGTEIRAENWQDIADLAVEDMADAVGYLEGTERGFTVLMDEANRRFTEGRTQEPALEQQAPQLTEQAIPQVSDRERAAAERVRQQQEEAAAEKAASAEQVKAIEGKRLARQEEVVGQAPVEEELIEEDIPEEEVPSPVTSSEEDATFEKAKDTVGTFVRQNFGGVQNIAPEEVVSAQQALASLADIMYHVIKKGARNLKQAVADARQGLGQYGTTITNAQFKAAYATARAKVKQEAKAAKAAKPKVDSILLKIQRSESPEEMGGLLSKLMEADSWAGKKRVLNTIWTTLDSKSIATLLPALTTSQITDWVGDKIPHLNQVNRLVERMAVTRSKMLAAIDDTVKPWADFAKAHAAGGRLLSRLMHYSTLAEVDPSLHANAVTAIAKDSQLAELRRLMDAASNPRAKAAYKGQITSRINRITTAYKLWNEAGRVGKGEAHGIFTKVRDHYRATFNLHRAILDERIAKSSLSGDIDNEATPKGMLMAAIRKTYEDAKTVGVYFPLMRYGNYWMSLGKGPNKEFYMFESEVQRNLFIDERVEQLQKAGDNRTYDEILESGEFDAGNDLTKLRNLTTESSEMLQGIFKIIDTQNVTDKEALKDAVYQMYLLTMPEQSFRKQFIHRKGTTGFSGDALRNFVRSGYASANQLTRLQFGPDITTEMDSAHASLEGMPPKDKIKLSQFLNEVGTRVGEELAPSNEDEGWTKFANGVNQAAFFFRLTAIKSAIANMTALPIFGYPVLASKYGEVKAAAALAKYTKVFNHTTFVKPDGSYTPLSVGFSKHVQSSPILAAAFEEAAERGITEITRTYDLIAMARTPSTTHQGAISRGTRAVVNFAGLLFHHSERLNREIMFMTSFELAYKKGLSEGLSGGRNGEAFTRAIDESVKNTYDSMFNYTTYNRPRVMRSPAARIVFQFKLFPQQVTAYLLRNFLTMIKGSDLDPRARREATTQLVGTLMMTGMFAGVVGMPLYSMVIAVTEGIRNALRDDDDPIPIEERDLDLWFRNVWIPKYFGEAASFFEKGPISTITNADIASSTSLNNLWFRDTKYDASVANQFNDFIMGMAGPGASLITDGIKAVDDFNSGHFNQGVEKLLPAFAKGTYTQWAWGKEGIKVKGSQAEIYSKEEITNMMRLWKAFGFNPTELTRIQESNYPAMELIRRAQDERSSIMNRLDLELVREDDEAFEEALIKASKFTEANPEMPIMADTIVNSALKRAKLRAMADRGLIVPPKLMPRMYEFINPSRPKADRVKDQAAFDALLEIANTSPTEEGEE